MKLTPKIDEKIQKLLCDKNFVFDLMNAFGSPLNIIFPENIKQNINNFQEIFKKHRIVGHIYYAHKCNKSSAIAKEALYCGINIDVASLEELKHALSIGFVGNHIEATGPKNNEFIILGLRHNLLFNVDNLLELETIINFHKKIIKKEKTKILIRLNDFSSESEKFINRQSRFGISKKELSIFFQMVLDNQDILDFVGFSFHLDTVNIKEKIIAIENIILLFDKAYELGLNPSRINIGGGFKLNYLASSKEWDASISELKEAILNNDSDITWNHASFGLRVDNGILKGNLNLSNYYENNVKEKVLDEILSSKSSKFQNRMIGEILSENMIELMIEPGRSLLDQVGINITKIVYTKRSLQGDLLIGLDMNRTNLLIGEQEMLVDPILISKEEQEESATIGCYLLGNLCLESDLIFKHKIFFDTIPKVGDLLVFINTAGYFMDFNESKTIMQNIARKIVLTNENNKFNCYLDELYEPLKK